MPPKPDFRRLARERQINNANRLHQEVVIDEINSRTEIVENESNEAQTLLNSKASDAKKIMRGVWQKYEEQKTSLLENENTKRRMIRQSASNGRTTLFEAHQHRLAITTLLETEHNKRELITNNEQELLVALSQSEHQEISQKIQRANLQKELMSVQAKIKEIVTLNHAERKQKEVIYSTHIKHAYNITIQLHANNVANVVTQLEKRYKAQFISDNFFFRLITDGIQRLQGPTPTWFDHLHFQLVVLNLKTCMSDILFRDHGTKKAIISLTPISKFLSEEIFIYTLPLLLFRADETNTENSCMLACLNALTMIYDQLLYVRASITTAEYDHFPELIRGDFGFCKTTNLLSRFFTDSYPIDPAFFLELDKLFQHGKQEAVFHPKLKSKTRTKLTAIEITINKNINIMYEQIIAERKRLAELIATTSDKPTSGSNSAGFFTPPSCDPASAAAACAAALAPPS
jgi:hypothetical protein